MKHNLYTERNYISCACGDPTHLLCFETITPGETLDIYFTGNWKQVWWRRIWYALKFIFQRHPMCWSTGVIINNTNIHELEEVIKSIKENHQKE